MFPQLDPVVTAKRWVILQLVGVTITDWYNLECKTRGDGKQLVSGGCKAQDLGVVKPPRYRFEVVLTNTNDICGESWVRESYF
jgi:hypothetical protein